MALKALIDSWVRFQSELKSSASETTVESHQTDARDVITYLLWPSHKIPLVSARV